MPDSTIINALREIISLPKTVASLPAALTAIAPALSLSACSLCKTDGVTLAEWGAFQHKTESYAGSNGLNSPARFSGAIVNIGEPARGQIIAEWQNNGEEHVRETRKIIEICASLLIPFLTIAQEEAPAGKFGFVGSSAALRQVCGQIAIVAPSHTTVLLQGESGTGKELAARAIHKTSPVACGPFISLNCAALPENLMESELFGHEKGAFTGAVQMRRGRFELANGGTLFLDEIGELSPGLQAKLLRALQERAFERLGGMHTVRFDARIIAATNRDLAQMVEEGAFRRDLFYRLNVFGIHLPPLRERPEDILPMAAHFLRRHINGGYPVFSPEALEALQQHNWPGNGRELENVMERAALLIGDGNVLLPEHLPPDLQSKKTGSSLPGLAQKMNELELAYIKDALKASNGRISRAAALLNMTQRQLGLRMAKYGLSYKDYR